MKRVSLLLILLASIALCSPAGDTAFQVPIEYGFHPEDSSFTRAEQRVRDATVRVWPFALDGYGTGTYYKIGNRHFVLTANHVVDELDVVWVQERSQFGIEAKIPGQVMYRNTDRDVAIILLDEPLQTRRPLPYPRQPRSQRILGADVFYAGHPNLNDILTIKGQVAGQIGSMYFIQSFTWFGASGSNVFDEQGNLIGVLTGMDTYRDPETGEITDIVENLVVVSPLAHLGLSRGEVREILESDPPEIDYKEVLRAWGFDYIEIEEVEAPGEAAPEADEPSEKEAGESSDQPSQ